MNTPHNQFPPRGNRPLIKVQFTETSKGNGNLPISLKLSFFAGDQHEVQLKNGKEVHIFGEYEKFGKYKVQYGQKTHKSDHLVAISYKMSEVGKSGHFSLNEKGLREWAIEFCRNTKDAPPFGNVKEVEWGLLSKNKFTEKEFIKWASKYLNNSYASKGNVFFVYCWLAEMFKQYGLANEFKNKEHNTLATRIVWALPKMIHSERSLNAKRYYNQLFNLPVTHLNAYKDGETILHRYMRYRDLSFAVFSDLTKAMAIRGFSLNVPDVYKCTPLNLAAYLLLAEHFISLVQNGAKLKRTYGNDWLYEALCVSENNSFYQEAFFQTVIKKLGMSVFPEQKRNTEHTIDSNTLLTKYPKLVKPLDEEIYAHACKLGNLLDVSEGGRTRHMYQLLVQSLQSFTDPASLERGTPDRMVAKRVLAVFKNAGHFCEVRFNNGNKISICIYFERLERTKWKGVRHLRLHVVVKDGNGYYDYLCDGGGDGFPKTSQKNERRKLGILLCEINKNDFENWPTQKHLTIVDEKTEIETRFQLKMIRHLLDKRQEVGNCGYKSQELALQLIFAIFKLYHEDAFSHSNLEVLENEIKNNKLSQKFFQYQLNEHMRIVNHHVDVIGEKGFGLLNKDTVQEIYKVLVRGNNKLKEWKVKQIVSPKPLLLDLPSKQSNQQLQTVISNNQQNLLVKFLTHINYKKIQREYLRNSSQREALFFLITTLSHLVFTSDLTSRKRNLLLYQLFIAAYLFYFLSKGSDLEIEEE